MEPSALAALLAALPRYPRHLYHAQRTHTQPLQQQQHQHQHPQQHSALVLGAAALRALFPHDSSGSVQQDEVEEEAKEERGGQYGRLCHRRSCPAQSDALASPRFRPAVVASDALSHRPLHGAHSAEREWAPAVESHSAVPGEPPPLPPSYAALCRLRRRSERRLEGRTAGAPRAGNGRRSSASSTPPLRAVAVVATQRGVSGVGTQRSTAAQGDRPRAHRSPRRQRSDHAGPAAASDVPQGPAPGSAHRSGNSALRRPQEHAEDTDEDGALGAADGCADVSARAAGRGQDGEVLVLPGMRAEAGAEPSEAAALPAAVPPPSEPCEGGAATAPSCPPLLSCCWLLSLVPASARSLEWFAFALSCLPVQSAPLQAIAAFVHSAQSLLRLAQHERREALSERSTEGETDHREDHSSSTELSWSWSALFSLLPPPPALLEPLPSVLQSSLLALPRSPSARAAWTASTEASLPLTAALLLQWERLLRFRFHQRGLHVEHFDHLMHLAQHRLSAPSRTTKEGAAQLQQPPDDPVPVFVTELRRALTRNGDAGRPVSAAFFLVSFTFLFLLPLCSSPMSSSPLPCVLSSVSAVFALLHPVSAEERERLQLARQRAEEAEWERERRAVIESKEAAKRKAEEGRRQTRALERANREAILLTLHPQAARLRELAMRGEPIASLPLLPWPRRTLVRAPDATVALLSP